jgi:predicted lipoprotein with Yx(FWY)xxD motif
MITDAISTSPAPANPRRGAKRSLTAIGAVAVVGLIAAVCGSSAPSASSSPTTIAQSPAGAPAATTKAGGTSKSVVNAEANTTIGRTILVNTSGMTLYTLASDSSGTSTCSAGCTSVWPPVTVASGVSAKGGTGTSGVLATITRSDGSLQVTYNGMPLYTFSGDNSAGSTSGSGLKDSFGRWSVVKIGSKTTTPVAKTPTTTKAPSGGGYGY